MFVAGVDVGNQTGKAVILRDDRSVVAKAVIVAAEEASAVAEQVLAIALAQAHLKREDITRIIATGVGRNGVTFANRAITEVSCDAKGAVHLTPTVRTIIDIGAEDARGLKCDEAGRVLDFVMNDKCASGAGVFVEAMAAALEISVYDIGELALRSQQEIDINSTCAVFAESEVVSLIHRQTPREDIARGIHDSIALRTSSMLRRIGMHDDLMLVGGAALNAGIVDSMRRRTGKAIVVPEDPVTVGALGAALFALEESAA